MNPPLEDKIAFFQHLDVFSGRDADEDEVENDVVRKKARIFVAAAGAQASRGADDTNAGPSRTVRRRLTVQDTPEALRRPLASRGTGADPSGLSTSVVVETPVARRLPAQPVAPASRPSSSFPPAVGTRAGGAMPKRKQAPEVRLVSPERRYFQGLRFFYVPNNDINPGRKLRIRRAREHGAEWVGSPSEATHVVVDRGLSRADVEAVLGLTPATGPRLIVDENYPAECIEYGLLLSADQKRYQVKNGDDRTSPSPPPPRVDQASPSAPRGTQPGRQPSPRAATVNPASPASPASAADTPDLPPQDDLGSFIEHIKKWGDDVVIFGEADDKDPDSDLDEAGPPSLQLAKGSGGRERGFACMRGGTKDGWSGSPNTNTIETLKKLADEYVGHDYYRAQSYHTAAAALTKQDVKILTARDAQKIRGIGQSIASTIEEIATEGRSRKLKALQDDPHNRIRAAFLGIYGVGVEQANKWIQEGLRTLDDVRARARLSSNQRLGLEHYDDLNTRIPRREVEALGAHVERAAQALDPDVRLVLGGSYRRGAATSGDVDLIVTKPGTHSAAELAPFLDCLVARLGGAGFLTATLAAHRRRGPDDAGGSQWHGCCVLPPGGGGGGGSDGPPVWRRIDLLLVPEAEMGAALIYFTGDNAFNRSIRLKAQTLGMRLNQRGLYRDVLRDGNNVKVARGTLLEGRDERKIFAHLGVTWREPHERWCS